VNCEVIGATQDHVFDDERSPLRALKPLRSDLLVRKPRLRGKQLEQRVPRLELAAATPEIYVYSRHSTWSPEFNNTDTHQKHCDRDRLSIRATAITPHSAYLSAVGHAIVSAPTSVYQHAYIAIRISLHRATAAYAVQLAFSYNNHTQHSEAQHPPHYPPSCHRRIRCVSTELGMPTISYILIHKPVRTLQHVCPRYNTPNKHQLLAIALANHRQLDTTHYMHPRSGITAQWLKSAHTYNCTWSVHLQSQPTHTDQFTI
jgi:hypothetical protein